MRKGDLMSSIYEIYGNNAREMTISLMAAAKVAARISEGAKVVIKPNLVNASGAENGATTHPGAVAGCIEYLKDAGFSDISVIESSWVGEQTGNAMRVCGYDKICSEQNVPFCDLSPAARDCAADPGGHCFRRHLVPGEYFFPEGAYAAQ